MNQGLNKRETTPVLQRGVFDDELHDLINDESDEDEVIESVSGDQEQTDLSKIKAKNTVMSNLLDLYSGLYRILRA